MTKAEITKLVADLQSTSSSKRRDAAKKLGANLVTSAGKSIYEALKKELLDSRSWETKVRMVEALGMLGFKPASQTMLDICKKNEPHDAVTAAAAQSYVRLKRKSLRDTRPVVELLQFAGYSVAAGAFDALGYDRMMPDEKDKKAILECARSFPYIPGVAYPGFGVAVAAAGWRGDEVREFLEFCLTVDDQSVVNAATQSLQSKYADI